MDRKEELKDRLGEQKREEGGPDAEREARRSGPVPGVRPEALDEERDRAVVDEPGARGVRERAEERIARRGPARPGDPEEPR